MSAVMKEASNASGSYVFPDGSSLVRARHLAWTPWAVPGVEFKLLDVDRSFDKCTMLLRAAQGATIPAIKQSGAFEVFVEAGQMQFERGALRKGDFVYLPGGGRNGPFKLAAGTQLYAIVHGPLRMEKTFVDADWMIDALADSEAGKHITAVLMAS